MIMTEANKRVPFVMIFLGRTGSSYVVEALSRHPEIMCKREEHLSTLIRQKKTAKEQLDWVRAFSTQQLTAPVTAVGFKTKLKDVLDPIGFADLLTDLHARVIHLGRRNVVKTTVSWFNSIRLNEASGHWNIYDDKVRLPPANIEPDRFHSMLCAVEKDMQREATFVDSLDLPKLAVSYEELLLDRADFFENIYSFLDVNSYAPAEKVFKATSDDLRDALSNHDQLRARYAGTVYEPLFDEVLVKNE